MNKIIRSILLFFVILFSACSQDNSPKYRIGVSQCSHDEWRDKMNNEMRREMLFHDDATIEIVSAGDNNDKQISDIQSFIDRKFDIIIVAPNEAEAITPIVNKAYDSGIPVIIFDRRISNDSYTSYIDLDNKGIGLAAAGYALSLLGNSGTNEVMEITGLAGSSPAQERHSGFVEGLSLYPSLKLVASEAGDWDREKAAYLTDSLLNLYPQVKLVYAHSDNMAIGVSEVLKKRGREDIRVLGTDASPGQGIEAVKDGTISATFIYPTEGHRIIKTAFAILNGEPYEKTVHIPSLTSVDKNNAEILQRQYELLNEETQKVLLLDEKNDELLLRYKEQSVFLYTVIGFSIALLILLAILGIILWKNILLQRQLKQKNQSLIDEHERHRALYSKLENAIQENKNPESEFYNRFISIIQEQYSNADLNTEAIASQLNLGNAQLTRKIKSLTNYTPVEILRNYRMEQVRKLLLSTDSNINEITYSVGFSSPAYLTKCFREHFGLTPTELRASRDYLGPKSSAAEE